MRRLLSSLAAASLLAACSGGSDSPPPPPPSGCGLADFTCISGPGLNAAVCANDWAGTWLPAGCPAADRISICTGIPDLIVMGAAGSMTYYASGWDAAGAVADCVGYWGGDYQVACAPGGGTATTVRCLFTGDMCDAVTGIVNACQLDHLSYSCSISGGGYAVGTCSTSGAVAGHCRYGEGAMTALTGVPISGAFMQEYYYTGAPGYWTVPDAQFWCSLEPAGVWMYSW